MVETNAKQHKQDRPHKPKVVVVSKQQGSRTVRACARSTLHPRGGSVTLESNALASRNTRSKGASTQGRQVLQQKRTCLIYTRCRLGMSGTQACEILADNSRDTQLMTDIPLLQHPMSADSVVFHGLGPGSVRPLSPAPSVPERTTTGGQTTVQNNAASASSQCLPGTYWSRGEKKRSAQSPRALHEARTSLPAVLQNRSRFGTCRRPFSLRYDPSISARPVQHFMSAGGGGETLQSTWGTGAGVLPVLPVPWTGVVDACARDQQVCWEMGCTRREKQPKSPQPPLFSAFRTAFGAAGP